MIAIIDYGAGNTASVSNALNALGTKYILTNTLDEIAKAEKIILPGVGEASYAMNKLKKLNLIEFIRKTDQPLLGICLGMQLLTNFSDEGNTECIDLFDITTKKFLNNYAPVPHMGWNKVKLIKDSKLFFNIKDEEYFYFAHSYYIPEFEKSSSISTNEKTFTASLEKQNFYGVQFHPEKSSTSGIQLLKNFIELC